MSLKTQLELIEHLQTAQTKRRQAEEGRRELPEKLARLEEDLRDLRQDMEKARERQEAMVQKRRTAEKNVELEEDRIAKSRERLPLIKNNKEFQALQTEIEKAGERKSALEDEVLNLMISSEELDRQVREVQEELDAAEAEVAERQKETEKALEALEREAEEAEASRADLSKQIEPKLLATFLKVQEQRGGVGIVHHQNGNCLGCHMQIPPQMTNEILHYEKIILCPNCGRILC